MISMTKSSKIIVSTITLLWSCIMLAVSCLMYFQISVSTHYSFEILLEFTKAITLWYIIGIATAFAVDITLKNIK